MSPMRRSQHPERPRASTLNAPATVKRATVPEDATEKTSASTVHRLPRHSLPTYTPRLVRPPSTLFQSSILASRGKALASTRIDSKTDTGDATPPHISPQVAPGTPLSVLAGAFSTKRVSNVLRQASPNQVEHRLPLAGTKTVKKSTGTASTSRWQAKHAISSDTEVDIRHVKRARRNISPHQQDIDVDMSSSPPHANKSPVIGIGSTKKKIDFSKLSLSSTTPRDLQHQFAKVTSQATVFRRPAHLESHHASPILHKGAETAPTLSSVADDVFSDDLPEDDNKGQPKFLFSPDETDVQFVPMDLAADSSISWAYDLSFVDAHKDTSFQADGDILDGLDSSDTQSRPNRRMSNASAPFRSPVPPGIVSCTTPFVHFLDEHYFRTYTPLQSPRTFLIASYGILSCLVITPQNAAEHGVVDPAMDYFESTFEVISLLGRGEFADVFRVRLRSNKRVRTRRNANTQSEEWAIKRKREAFAGMRDRARCLEEVRILLRLGHHPHCTVLQSAWEQRGILHLQLEHCVHGSLKEWLDMYARLTRDSAIKEVRIWRVLGQACAALKHIHGCQVLHLDVKPANVLLTQDYRIKLADFGLATMVQDINAMTYDLDREGDRAYLSPEILQQNVYSTGADVYSLGLIILEMSGNVVLPGEGDAWRRLREGDIETGINWDGRSRELKSLVMKMLQPDPLKRCTIAHLLSHSRVKRALQDVANGVRSGDANIEGP